MASSTRAWVRALESVARMQRDPALTLPAMLDALAAEHGDRPALLGTGATLSYAELARRSDRIARWAGTHRPGATIGLLLPNCTEYVAIWLGLTRAGCTVALLNHQLAGDALAHTVRAASCRLLIVDPAFAGRVEGLAVMTADELAAASDACTGPLPPPPAPADTALLIFTSGTTGLPKAARLSHGRVLEWALWFAGMMDVGRDDRLYDCLPLYHSTGGVVAIGASLVRGASVWIAPGFSAGRFWDDVADHDCTVFFYIGELCRYLLNAGEPGSERPHRLRLACGNGLQASVWEPFQARFGIPAILEFYAATEGSVSLYNCEGRPGSIGRVPPFLHARFPLAMIRVDLETGEPVRGLDGLCIVCGPDEPGEALGRVDRAGAAPARRFDGYTDPEASAAKLLHDVLQPGDCWFRSGDLMRRDASGFVYFVDRMGDTFRWKGENVSTGEVAAIVRACPGVRDAVVYGVRVPGQEGRAGMAAIVAAPGFDPAELWSQLTAALPAYARPLFVRLCGRLDMTGTFKLSASRLAREAYVEGDDQVLFRSATGFVACDAALIAAIGDGSMRV